MVFRRDAVEDEDTLDAMAYVEAGKASGKVVVTR